jgi:hypothetical protein
MDNIIDVHKTIYSPIGRFIVSRMASSVYWSNDHMVNEIKTNPQLFKEFHFILMNIKNNYSYYLFICDPWVGYHIVNYILFICLSHNIYYVLNINN